MVEGKRVAGCLLCGEGCCPEHCCDWDSCTCGDCPECTVGKRQPDAMPAEAKITSDSALIVNLLKPQQPPVPPDPIDTSVVAVGSAVRGIRYLRKMGSQRE